MKNIIPLFTLFLTVSLNAQNLVPNPSFEVYTELSTFMNNGKLDYAIPWFDTPAYPEGGGISRLYKYYDALNLIQ
jgi:hypothetical protein